MSDDPAVIYDIEGAIARITLNRPAALNAFDTRLRSQLTAAFARAEADETVHAVVLTGAGRAFSSGADLKAGMKDGADTRRQLLEEYAPSVNAIVNLSKPVIAAVEGFVAGVGCAHVLASDLVVMAEDAFLLLPFSSIALVPDGGLTWLLERRLGHRIAFELAADAQRVSASRCRELGLVNRVVPKGAALATASEWAHQLAAGAPLALAHTKRLLRECASLDLRQAQRREAEAQSQCIDSEDFREGVSAFFAKRTPRFTGREAARDLASDVRAGFELDPTRTERYLREHVPGFSGPLTVQQFNGGQSNPTYMLRTPERNYVLRRKPAGQLLPSAHAVDREYRIMQVLRRHSDVPVPEVLSLCTDDSVIGSAFYVMAHVSGRMFWDTSFPAIPSSERRYYFDAMNAALASLHNVDYVAAGLGDYGKPGSYFERQIGRWSQQYLADAAAGRVSDLDRVTDWLRANIPSDQQVSLVHGDYRCDNLIFHPTEPRVLAVLDWELSTLGHPLADFGYHLMMYRLPTLAVSGLLDRDLSALRITSEPEYVAAYCARTRRDGIEHLEFYVAFNLFRFAAILHGIRGRLLRGNAVSERAREYARHVEAVAGYAWQTARGAN